MINLLRIICLLFISSCHFKACEDLGKSFNGAKADISSFSSISKKPSNKQIHWANKSNFTTATSTEIFDYSQCVPFSKLTEYDIYYVDTKLAKSGDGRNWDKAFLTINEAIMAIIAKRSNNLKNGEPILPAIVAIAQGVYTYTKEKVITNEIFSLYGYQKELYKNLSFLGGFKNGDICKNVSKNDGYNYTDSDRQTIIDAENKTKIISAIDASTLTFSDFIFRNTTTKNITNKKDGGAVSLKSTLDVIFNRIKIEDSFAHEAGGAFFIQNSQGIGLADTFIEKVYAKGNGGAIAIINSKVLINIINISQAQSKSSGGGIYSDQSSDLALGYFVLSDNKALNGAGLYNEGKLVIHTNTNHPTQQNTFLYVTLKQHNSVDVNLNRNFVINTLANNEALNDGGAIYYDHHDKLELERIIIEDNKALNGAGIYFAKKAHISLTNNRFVNNHAFNNAGVFYFNDGTNFSIATYPASGNNKYNVGFIKNGILLNYFHNNKANNEGGVFYIAGDVDDSSSITLHTLFKANKANKGSVIVLNNQVKNSDLKFYHGNFEENEGEEAGVFYIDSADVKKITINGNFNNNKVNNADAAIFKSLHPLEQLIINGNYQHNTCVKNATEHECDGAAFNIHQVQKLRIGSSIKEHTAKNGGFLWLNKADELLIYAAASIKDNQASMNGGVIYAHEANKIFIVEKQSSPGGLSQLFLSVQHRLLRFKQSGGNYLSKSNLIFSFNKALVGGALYIQNSQKIVIQDAIFHSNIANFGGAIYIDTIAQDLEVKESFFSNNTASAYGGALYIGSLNNAFFDGKRDMNTRIAITHNKKEYMDSNFKLLAENDKKNAVNNFVPIEHHLEDLTYFDNASYSIDKVYMPLAKNNIASEGAFAYFGNINNLNLQYMSMVNNKNPAIHIHTLLGNINKDQHSIIYDDGDKIKNIEVFLNDDYSTKYHIGNFPKGIVNYSSYEDDIGSSLKIDTGIKVLFPANKSVASD